MGQEALQIIARARTEFTEKFGIPRQSGLVPSLRARIVFEPGFRSPDALRGLEEFSHLWLIWGFSKARRAEWSPTVRPPRLGGNRRLGVFATRSPFRPNGLGLSSVRLEGIEMDTQLGPVLHVLGADLLDDSPIYDIKPYLAYTDSHPEAAGGFTDREARGLLGGALPEKWRALVPEEILDALLGVLSNDPRPSYQEDPERLYGMAFSGLEVKFTVAGDVLTVRGIERV